MEVVDGLTKKMPTLLPPEEKITTISILAAVFPFYYYQVKRNTEQKYTVDFGGEESTLF